MTKRISVRLAPSFDISSEIRVALITVTHGPLKYKRSAKNCCGRQQQIVTRPAAHSSISDKRKYL